MSRFEYLSVLISILIALGLSEMVSSWGRMLRRRHLVRFDWVHAAWSLVVVLLLVQFWWGFWNFRTIESWSFPGLLGVVTQSLVLVLAALVLTPRDVPDTGLDLGTYFDEQNRLFFVLSILLLAFLAGVDSLVAKEPLLHLENAIRAVAIGILTAALLTRRRALHGALALAGLALFLWFQTIAIYR